MNRCVVIGCKSRSGAAGHKFPANRERAERWRAAINSSELLKLHVVDLHSLSVCGRHFTEADYYFTPTGDQRLIKGAVPSRELSVNSSSTAAAVATDDDGDSEDDDPGMEEGRKLLKTEQEDKKSLLAIKRAVSQIIDSGLLDMDEKRLKLLPDDEQRRNEERLMVAEEQERLLAKVSNLEKELNSSQEKIKHYEEYLGIATDLLESKEKSLHEVDYVLQSRSFQRWTKLNEEQKRWLEMPFMEDMTSDESEIDS